ncbi:hypothetical protein EIL50_01495 [bacterium NHP-B]|nr:hypothetical protein EIL50_01495 [bacterium NHP-B]
MYTHTTLSSEEVLAHIPWKHFQKKHADPHLVHMSKIYYLITHVASQNVSTHLSPTIARYARERTHTLRHQSLCLLRWISLADPSFHAPSMLPIPPASSHAHTETKKASLPEHVVAAQYQHFLYLYLHHQSPEPLLSRLAIVLAHQEYQYVRMLRALPRPCPRTHAPQACVKKTILKTHQQIQSIGQSLLKRPLHKKGSQALVYLHPYYPPFWLRYGMMCLMALKKAPFTPETFLRTLYQKKPGKISERTLG